MRAMATISQTRMGDMMNPGRMAQYQDIFEFKSPDHYTLTSRAQGEDGEWVTFMTAEVNRKK